MSLKLNEIKNDDKGTLAPCGILCLGCDTHTGESLEAAKTLKEIWEGMNIEDIGPFTGLNLKEIQATFKTLDKYIKANKKGSCPGCFVGGGPSQICGIANCVKSKGFWTCAECEEYKSELDIPCPHVKKVKVPMTDKGSMMGLICMRYNRDNVQNLIKCREIGYSEFIKEAKKKVADGWRTWQVISKEKIFSGNENK